LDSFLLEYVADSTQRAIIKATIEEEYTAMRSYSAPKKLVNIATEELTYILTRYLKDATKRQAVINQLTALPAFSTGTVPISSTFVAIDNPATGIDAPTRDLLKGLIKQELVTFLETVADRKITGVDANGNITYQNYTFLTKRRGLEDVQSVKISEGANLDSPTDDRYLRFKVAGVITQVDANILRTPAVIVDSLLGQGEALDQFAILAQESTIQKAILENEKLRIENQKQEAELARANAMDEYEQARKTAETNKLTQEAHLLDGKRRILDSLRGIIDGRPENITAVVEAVGKLTCCDTETHTHTQA
jgi:hypothetical protein